MLHRMLQVEVDGAGVDAEEIRNVFVVKLINVGGQKHAPLAVGQFGESFIQFLEVEAALDDHGRVRTFIRNVGDGGDFPGA